MKWEKVKLGELYDVHNGLSKGSKYFGSGQPFLTFSTVFNNFFVPKELKSLVQTTDKEQESCSIRRGDVFITRTSETMDELGMSCVALRDYEKATYNGFTKRLRPKNNMVWPEYIGYYLRTPLFRGNFKAFSSMTTRASLKNEDLLKMDVVLPPISVQQRIASILSAYDDLIENNQKQIKLLEEAAQRLYKEWFVDLRFPGYENVKVVDGVPEGWRVMPISSVADLKAGGDKPKDFSLALNNDFNIPVYTNGVSNKGLIGYTNKAVVTKPSVTISARGTVGVVFFRSNPYVPIVRLISVVPKEESMDAFYLYLSLQKQKFRFTGSAQQQITIPLIIDRTILCPSDNIRQMFHVFVKPIFNKLDVLEKQIEALKEARDRLLPKLMNGELEV